MVSIWNYIAELPTKHNLNLNLNKYIITILIRSAMQIGYFRICMYDYIMISIWLDIK